MSEPAKEQLIEVTNLDADEAKMHQNLGGNLRKLKQPGSTRPPHEEHPLSGTLKELGPYVLKGLKETMTGQEMASNDRITTNEGITSIYEAKEGKKEVA